ncbi:MAG: histidinol dehydrogenase [Fusobacteriaceae bacterium]|nr:histidinol dehydrogenase [Fusobacteriaceae bacterium]MBN2837888.1 histidinol dehydrogenase [Fusobacteriaceae bacterium]
MRIITNKQQVIDEVLNRSQFELEEVNKKVKDILDNIKKNGDKALFEYTEKFDGVKLDNLKVSENEIEEAYNSLDKELIKSLEEAHNNIEKFHKNQVQKSFITNDEEGKILGQIVNPIEKVGIYVPGGTAPLPSTVLMNAIPAKVAGVNKIVMTTPPAKDGKISSVILAAAKIAGVTEIYKLGGAQAIGALAFGTETVPKVYKIVGPGNIYVAMAKKQVFGSVDIDMVAGPSEVLVIADSKANAKYIAADLLSQAEHDTLACSILVTPSNEVANSVAKEVEKQLEKLSRNEIARKSIENYGRIIVTENMNEAIDLANEIAPEHLELAVENPFDYLSRIKNAGAIFLGEYSPEPLGDYFAGPNHTLPTSGTAKFASPLSVDAFIKKSSVIYYTREALAKVKDSIIRIAESETLTAHANSVRVRFEDDKNE